MSETTANVAELHATIEALNARLAALEARLSAVHPEDEVPVEVVLAISAACAAYLGHRAKVKQVRLRHNQAWTDAGRFDIQHSHRIQRSR